MCILTKGPVDADSDTLETAAFLDDLWGPDDVVGLGTGPLDALDRAHFGGCPAFDHPPIRALEALDDAIRKAIASTERDLGERLEPEVFGAAMAHVFATDLGIDDELDALELDLIGLIDEGEDVA